MHLACMGSAGMLARLAWEAIAYQQLGRLGRQCHRKGVQALPLVALENTQPAAHTATTKAPAAHKSYKLHVKPRTCIVD